MKISINEILSLISDITEFADASEKFAGMTRNFWLEQQAKIKAKYEALLGLAKTDYEAECSEVRGKSQSMIDSAKMTLSTLNEWDRKLSMLDKYYVKTRKKLYSSGREVKANYSEAGDYFFALNEIQKRFKILSKKYSEHILPFLINDLHYLFSKQRKQDYEELIGLQKTASSFISELERDIPSMTSGVIADIDKTYASKKKEIIIAQKKEQAEFEAKYSSALAEMESKIKAKLDSILDESSAEYLSDIIVDYCSGLTRVNSGSDVKNNILNMFFSEYQVDQLVGSKDFAALIKDRCRNLMSGSSIMFPVAMTISYSPAWFVEINPDSYEHMQNFSHAFIFGMMSSVPVSHLKFTIIDPEHRGSNIFPFLEARKKLPEMFGEKIYSDANDISDVISDINKYIDLVMQDSLGNKYDNIFDFCTENSQQPDLNVIVIYDFPAGFRDERSLNELRNIIRSGSKCGIYTMVLYSKINEDSRNFMNSYLRTLNAIKELCFVITQKGDSFYFMGMPLIFQNMPDKISFSNFFSRYMLIHEGIKNKGIAFSPLIKRLAEAKNDSELEIATSQIQNIINSSSSRYGLVPEPNIGFPQAFSIASVFYPADIFSDSPCRSAIMKKFGASSGFVELPLILDLRNRFNLMLNFSEPEKQAMTSLTHNIIWSFLSFIPVNCVNIAVFDPEQRGAGVLPFLELRKNLQDEFEIFTGKNEIHSKLQELNAKINSIIEHKLAAQYKDILDYNSHSGGRPEAVTLLLIYDFPYEMDAQCVDLLEGILRSGSRCGVFMIICRDVSAKINQRHPGFDEKILELQKYFINIDYKASSYSLLPYNLQLLFPDMPSSSEAKSFIQQYSDESKRIKNQGLSFEDAVLRDTEVFVAKSGEMLKIPIGVGDGDKVINMIMGADIAGSEYYSSHHCLIAGAIGSGKSTLLHTLIMSSMLTYSPDELNLYLMDFKSGIEFKIYELTKPAHIKFLALDALQEFGESILERLVKEIETRSNIFKAAGEKLNMQIEHIRTFTKATGEKMPRILVIMDEFQILYNEASNRKTAANCAQLTKRIITEGRSYGIHLVMATQSTKVISNLSLERGSIEQMRIRIGLKCSYEDARYLFTDMKNSEGIMKDDDALRKMKGPVGTAVMNYEFTEQDNVAFRAVYCGKETQQHYLNEISKAFPRTDELYVFEGSRTVRLCEYFASKNIVLSSELPVKIHCGILIKAAPPLELIIDRKRRHNLLICGSDERMSKITVNDYIISALMNINSKVFFIDGNFFVGDYSLGTFYSELAELSHGRFKYAENNSQIISFIREVYDEYLLRKKNNSEGNIFIIVQNLQFIDLIKAILNGEKIDEAEYLTQPAPADEIKNVEQEESNPSQDLKAAFGDLQKLLEERKKASNSVKALPKNSDNISTKLSELIENGSGFGINFVISSLEYQIIREFMHSHINKFPERIIFSLSDNDAYRLIDGVSTSGLDKNIVYFTDGINTTLQLKPYIAPDNVDELHKIFIKEV